MNAPEALAVWHLRDRERIDGKWTLCRLPWPGDPVGVVQPCRACLDEHKRRKEG